MKPWMLVLLVLFSVSCQEIEEVEKPKNLIPEKKMAEVLTDLSLVTSAKNYNRRMLEQTGFKPKEFLYQKHSIDSLSLANSTRFYAQNPAILERIYSKVQKNLESLKADLEIIREEEIRVQDSIDAATKENDSLGNKDDLIKLKDSLIPARQRSVDTLLPVPEMRRNRIEN